MDLRHKSHISRQGGKGSFKRLKPKTGQIGLYLFLLAVILGLMALIRWLPGKMVKPAPRPFTIAMICMPEVVRSDSTGLKGPGIEFVTRLESLSNRKIRIIPIADRTAALQTLLAGTADIAGPMLPSDTDTAAAFSDVVVWKEFATSDPAVASHPAAKRSKYDTITLSLKWAVRRSDTALLRTVNNLLD